MIKYKAGYLLTVDSWENDGDNKATKQIHYTNKAELKSAVEFCKLFTKSHHDGTGFVGNFYDVNEHELESIQDIFYEFHLKNKEFLGEDSSDETLICDWCMDSGYDFGLTGGDFYTRKCDGIKVEYFKEDVHSEDVTKDFV
jgi:hypothetical protein